MKFHLGSRLIVSLATFALTTGVAGGAFAYWKTTGTGAGSALAATSWTEDGGGPSDGLTVSAVTLENSGAAGRLNAGDRITVAFSAPVRPSTVCSSFSDTGATTLGSGSTSNGDFTLHMKDHAAAPATTYDEITITAAGTCGDTINLGTLSLGSTAWTTASREYQANGSNATTLAISADHKTVTVKVGSGPTTPTTSPSQAAITSATSTFTPDVDIRDDATDAIAPTGTQTTTTLF